MRRRTKIVLVITLMVAVLVTFYSYLYVSQLLRLEISGSHDTAAYVASQLGFLANSAVPDLSSTKTNTSNPEALRRATVYYLSTDANLNDMLRSIVGSFPTIYDAAIVNSYGKVILHSDPDFVGKEMPDRPDLERLQDADFRQQLRMVYNPPTVYEVRMPLQLNGTPFGSIRLGISTIFIKAELTPRLQRTLLFSGIAILLSLMLAAGLSHIALGPLERLSRNLDSATAGNADAILPESEGERDEYGLVTLKIAHLGKQMRDAREIFSALKDNVDQIMANLQDGLMLFTSDLRVVLVSASVERFVGRPRRDLLGRTAKEVFTGNSPLGELLLEAFQRRRAIPSREVEAANARRVQVSLDFIQERGTQIGALLTLRDAESRHRIEDEIELSRRMSASGRVTRGVAHEVKNPINAIVLHLQLLKSKVQQIDPDTRRHMEIIDKEIHRLDRVVQILVDFTRPRDLRMEDTDLRRLLEDVAVLATPDAERHGVSIKRNFQDGPLMARIDADLIKQAILNVVLNGVQAMSNGGTLSISARADHENVITDIRDQGVGIPPEVQEKIFELYFTTKSGGSGIGLAQTFQIVQWHNGSIDFESVVGQGTMFRICLPRVEPAIDGTQAVESAAPVQNGETAEVG